MSHKKPVSVLVVIHSPELDILLLERAAHPGYWQSVTGSQEGDEALIDTARREVAEETGIAAAAADLIDWQQRNVFEIFPEWRHRYAPGVTHNVEHVFSLEVARDTPVRTAPDEHLGHCWLPLADAAAKVFSWSNRDAILALPQKRRR
ncbi:dihydroneopterin triphosphate diphosphatase [Azospira restricta]|uniref:Dihydroneopterin triphosphate diphosphatase n=1 Tax=Azospira restricta TaxID=404405 RepID=A0A974SRJ3_9RHOO|nr:dihydroneopterin triphosphate diphosphatase [Azospira restricta]QRJ65126.1 dihydroneopterin triphosphate diphosphatase [Azospira restricta]